MAESIVSDWLAEYAALEDATEIHTFIADHENNHEVASALFTIINERLKYPDVLHSICNQLFSYYRSNEAKLKSFTLQFVPTLIYTYLNAVAAGDKRSCRSVETLLLGIYNIEVSTDDGQPKVVSFRMPVLAQASIYHEEKCLNAYDLRRWEENSNKDVNWGPLPQVESVNAQNRLKIMTAVMFVYNQQLSSIPKSSLYHLCRMATQLVNQGFAKYGHAHRASYGSDPNSGGIAAKPTPRIPISAQFLLELLNATYFAMFNEFASIAIQTVDDIHNRACYELYPEVILVTNAIKNSLHANASGQPSDGPMGISSVALTPSTHTVTVSKSMITNASFRTKKLPDDIPIQAGDEGASSNLSQLISITEEAETGGGGSTGGETQLGMRNNLVRSSKEILKTHKVPFPGFNKKKDKDKEKDKMQVDGSGGGGASGATAGQTAAGQSVAKVQSSKNGNIFTDGGVKESVIIAATKQLTKKEKRGSSAALQAISIDASDATYLDKTTTAASPLSLQMKRKSSSVDVSSSNGPTISTIEMSSSTFANGNPVINEETGKPSPTNGDAAVAADGNITDTNSTDLSSIISTEHNQSKSAATNVAIVANNNIQISQV